MPASLKIVFLKFSEKVSAPGLFGAFALKKFSEISFES